MHHRINTTSGHELRGGPTDHTMLAYSAIADRIRKCGIKRSKRRIAIMLYLTSGWTPWGVNLGEEPSSKQYNISLCGRSYIMCCGHIVREKEAQKFVDAGLLMAGKPDRFNRPTLIITEAGRIWLSINW